MHVNPLTFGSHTCRDSCTVWNHLTFFSPPFYFLGCLLYLLMNTINSRTKKTIPAVITTSCNYWLSQCWENCNFSARNNSLTWADKVFQHQSISLMWSYKPGCDLPGQIKTCKVGTVFLNPNPKGWNIFLNPNADHQPMCAPLILYSS